MKKSEYLQRATKAYDTGRIDAETYDSMLMNADIFCEEDDEDYPSSYYDKDEYDNLWEGEKQMNFDRNEWHNR